ncbi:MULTISPECIES: hypothetical protein [unclassified Micromonospora]|uniref:hypothetical protein n=1 Tax=unclassified Micromonospora TaxID=2617518 RepID=UPI003A8BECE3
MATGTNHLPAGSSVATYPNYPGSNDSPTQTVAFRIVVTEDCTGFRRWPDERQPTGKDRSVPGVRWGGPDRGAGS